MTDGINNFHHIFIIQIKFFPSLYITVHYCTLLYITVHYCTFYFIHLYIIIWFTYSIIYFIYNILYIFVIKSNKKNIREDINNILCGRVLIMWSGTSLALIYAAWQVPRMIVWGTPDIWTTNHVVNKNRSKSCRKSKPFQIML